MSTKLKIFCVYDTKTEAYDRPFYCLTRGEAIRSFSDEVNNPNSMLAKHPSDFALFDVGSFCQLTGTIESNSVPINIGLAQEFIKSE